MRGIIQLNFIKFYIYNFNLSSLIQIQLMKSKYFDLKKFKQSLDPPEINNNSRKHTKPKKNHKIFLGHDNQTESDYQQDNSEKQKKKTKFPSKKVPKQIIKSHNASPKKSLKQKHDESSSNNQLKFNKQFDRNQRLKSFRTGRQTTEQKTESNFIGQLNNYLNELKKSKLDLSEDPTSKNQTLLMSKLGFREKQKQLHNTIQNSSRLEKKIKKQQSINRNLQKCIIEIQKVLWDRSDQLQILQEQVRRSVRQKQKFLRRASDIENNSLSKTIFFNQDFRNKKDSVPNHQNRHFFHNQGSTPVSKNSKIHSKQKPVSIYYKTNSDTDQQSSATFMKKPRRKTQATMNIEKVFENTLNSKGLNRTKLLKTYSKFERQQLNDI